MACRITELIIDCTDPDALAPFWTELLGYTVVERDDAGVALQGAPGAGPTLLLIRDPDPKTVKNRLHLDVNATDRDQDVELERILALGATPVDIGQGDPTWVVLADPEGNEFCLLRRRVDPDQPLPLAWPSSSPTVGP